MPTKFALLLGFAEGIKAISPVLSAEICVQKLASLLKNTPVRAEKDGRIGVSAVDCEEKRGNPGT